MARQRLAASTDEQPNYLTLVIGSDVEISRRLWNRLNEIYGRVVYSEGHIWYYGRTHWQPFPEHELRRLVQEFDGARYPTPSGSLAWLLGGVFKGDPDSSEKAHLLAEICGVAAVGHPTKLLQPRAVVLHGSSAENGKGQILVSCAAYCQNRPPAQSRRPSLTAYRPAALCADAGGHG
jgi:hypothetical protein